MAGPATWLRGATLIGVLMLAACTDLGPRVMSVDRFGYSSAIAESWKQQTLLNIVKLRYADLPVFLDVASVVAGYSLETVANVGGIFSSDTSLLVNSVTLGAGAKYTDRPTITYVPLTGEKFLRGLITPIDPRNIFSMLQAGYPADFILGLTVESLNGVRNRSAAGGILRKADPVFARALQLMAEIQAAGAVGVRVNDDKVRGKVTLLIMRLDDISSDVAAKQLELRHMLKLAPDLDRFALLYSPGRGGPNELAVNSRSMLQIMAAFSTYMEVPAEHRKDMNKISAALETDSADAPTEFHIHSSSTEPTDAFVAVKYRGFWFWIENSDWNGKRALMAIVYLFTLADAGSGERLPVITIPAQ
jgi:hypothetical protein